MWNYQNLFIIPKHFILHFMRPSNLFLDVFTIFYISRSYKHEWFSENFYFRILYFLIPYIFAIKFKNLSARNFENLFTPILICNSVLKQSKKYFSKRNIGSMHFFLRIKKFLINDLLRMNISRIFFIRKYNRVY